MGLHTNLSPQGNLNPSIEVSSLLCLFQQMIYLSLTFPSLNLTHLDLQGITANMADLLSYIILQGICLLSLTLPLVHTVGQTIDKYINSLVISNINKKCKIGIKWQDASHDVHIDDWFGLTDVYNTLFYKRHIINSCSKRTLFHSTCDYSHQISTYIRTVNPVCTLHRCYHIAFMERLSWLEAEEYCHHQNTSMLDINSHEELSLIKDLVRFLPGKDTELHITHTVFTTHLGKVIYIMPGMFHFTSFFSLLCIIFLKI